LEPDKPAPGKVPPGAPPAEPAPPPKVDSVAFARRREAVEGRVEITTLARLVSAGVEARGVLAWQVEGFVGRDQLQRQREYLRVRTRFSPWMTCSRCLAPVAVPELQTDTRFRFAASEQQAAAEDREADEEEVIAASANLDLAALVEDEAILALPMAPVHPACEWHPMAGAESGGDV
jgi:uncharacterized protein